MTLTSLSFGLFVLIALAAYYLCAKKYRWVILLLSSIAFYGIVCIRYMPYIVITTITTYLGALLIERMQTNAKQYVKAHKEEWTKEQKSAYKNRAEKQRKLVLTAFLVLNFGILAFLKYYDFFADSITSLLSLFRVTIRSPRLGLVLPLGISFYTFQAMGYLIDVYRQKVPAQKNLARFALFVSFFPQIIQGPIAIYDKLAGQLYEGHELEYKNIKFGFQLVMWGLAKKLILADRAVVLIQLICEDFRSYSGTWILAAALLYALQLYTDFSGGIDISRGVAQMFGIDMAENFRRPYFSKSISEYWRRWHITLGAWLKDYLFYPIAMSGAFLKLGRKCKARFGNHVGKSLPAGIATFITFVVIGIWHGANWKYVAFGVFNGGVIFFSNLMEPTFRIWMERLKIRSERLWFRCFQMLRTFLIVLIGYYFDIAPNFTAAMRMMYRSVTDVSLSDFRNQKVIDAIGLELGDYILLLAGMLFLFGVSLYQEKKQCVIREKIAACATPVRWSIMIVGAILILLFGMYGPGTSAAEFVYMQF